MLHLSGRVTLGVDIRDFLELQGSFQRNRKARAAAHVEGVSLLLQVGSQSVHFFFGAENLDNLKEQLTEQIGNEYAGASRTLVKRRLLDALDGMVEFELPQTLVEAEANSIAHQLWHEENPEVEGHDHPEIEPTEEHTKLAQRRVRLGLLLAEIGSREKVEITEAELGQAIMGQARQYPGQEREFFDFVRQNREALEQIRAPLFEDKVVDLILEKADVTDVPVSKEDLEKEIEALDEES